MHSDDLLHRVPQQQFVIVCAQLGELRVASDFGSAEVLYVQQGTFTVACRFQRQDAGRRHAVEDDRARLRFVVFQVGQRDPCAVRHRPQIQLAVAKILEETNHPDARVRLKALDMLGRITEVAVFTERVEIKKADMSDSEIDKKIKEKLNKFMGVVDVEDVAAVDDVYIKDENVDTSEERVQKNPEDELQQPKPDAV